MKVKLDDLHTTMAEQEATISALRLEVNKKNEQLGFITDEKVHLKPIRQSLCLIGPEKKPPFEGSSEGRSKTGSTSAVLSMTIRFQ